MAKKPAPKKPAPKKSAPAKPHDRYAVIDRNREISRHADRAGAEKAAAECNCRAGSQAIIQALYPK